MLHSLYVKNLALIEEIKVEFGEGLNILTGETGAGKSVILGSVGLALGGKYSLDMLRDENEPGYVELVFFVDDSSTVSALREMGREPEDGTMILARKLIGKRSVCAVNGETVPVSVLRDTASVLIDIHGQHEHQTLIYEKNQLAILDSFAGDDLKIIKDKVASLYAEYKSAKKELDESTLDEKQRLKETDLLTFELNEIENADLKEGEDASYEEQYTRMVNAKRITDDIDEAYGYTGSDDNGAGDVLSRALRCLKDAARIDPKAQPLCDELGEIDSLLGDFNRELSDYASTLEFSDETFSGVEARLNEINRLKSKYGATVEDILSYGEEIKGRLSRLNDYDAYVASLRKRLDEASGLLARASEELSGLRRKAAREFERAVRDNLQDLSFLDVRFEIEIREKEEYTANGRDEAEFMISMNPGEPLKPLKDVASGGELSRIMLAIKTVMADKDQVGTLIFDEIDAGISGRTAQKVSEKMALIGKSRQVICITHLAQIAAMADSHFFIEKKVTDGKTRTVITRLDEDGQVMELARILGGAKITDAVIGNAEEMKRLAKSC